MENAAGEAGRTQQPLRFGIFLAPFHPPGQDPTLALERDLELIHALDRLGYDEAWIGEHHSGGYEIIASPEVFMAVAAERTRHIRLGTGVSSLAYHHPLILADRMVLLDHLTRGRIIFGVGPGALATDAFMMGIDPGEQRRMMEESLEAIVALLAYDGPVTRKTDWFTLDHAQLQLRPYTYPRFEIGVAAMASPSGPRLAGRFGLSLLSLAATSREGFDALGGAWEVMETESAFYGSTIDRHGWRLVGPMHIAETEQQAREDVKFGLQDFDRYFQAGARVGAPPTGVPFDELLDLLNSTGFAVIGTPEMAVAQIERLQRQTGGFGAFLFVAHDWARPEATLHSYELFAKYVKPRFQLANEQPESAWAKMRDDRKHIGTAMMDAQAKAAEQYKAERAARERAAAVR